MTGTSEPQEEPLVHVVFPLEVDEKGWPPVSAERVWAAPLGRDTYRLENAPWFVRGVSEGDIVRAVPPSGEEWPVYSEVVRRSGNCTIRVIPRAAGSLEGSQAAVLDLFIPLGVTGEGAGRYPIVALTVPSHVSIRPIKALLQAGEQDGRWHYEEGLVTEEWRSE